MAFAVVGGLVNVGLVPAMAILSYLGGCRLHMMRPAIIVFSAVAVGGTTVLPFTGGELYGWLVRLGLLVVCGAFPWLAGRYRRFQVALVASGWNRAEQLEDRQRVVVERARLRERARIAYDMHDSLGYQLNLAALHAGALEIASDLDEQHPAKVRDLRGSMSVAVETLREIISVLHKDADPPL